MTREVHGEEVHGVDVDAETRCAHWRSEVDIIAIKFKCCGRWYPCSDCHEAIADHTATVWPAEEFSTEAVLCGSCGNRLTVEEYLNCGSTCPACKRAFNPGCTTHRHLYFAG